MMPIFHITSRAEAEKALRTGTYVSTAFHHDGFIHCSYARQLTRVADARFPGRSDLVLLEIDRDRVGCVRRARPLLICSSLATTR